MILFLNNDNPKNLKNDKNNSIFKNSSS